jgi:hypothetical protein
MMTTDLTCGACRGLLISIVEHAGQGAVVTLGLNTELYFDVDRRCTAICGLCGAATAIDVPKAFAPRLRRVEHPVPT